MSDPTILSKRRYTKIEMQRPPSVFAMRSQARRQLSNVKQNAAKAFYTVLRDTAKNRLALESLSNKTVRFLRKLDLRWS